MPTMKPQQGQNDIEEPPLVDSDLPTGDESKVVASDSAPEWDSIPKPSSMTSNGSIRKSALGTKSQEIFDKIKTRNNQSQITIEDAFETYTQSEEKDLRIKRLKYALCGTFIMVVLCAAAAFSSTFAAVNLSKESHISGGAMVGIDSATNNKAIVQVAQATDSKLNLFHALVLDEAHLRTMDEIVYSYLPDNEDTKVTRTDKVFRVERRVGEDPSDVNVTITMYGNTKVVIAPKEENEHKLKLFTDGKSYPLCGMMRCANFMVDDSDLDVNVLSRKVDIIMGVTDGDSRRLGQSPDANTCAGSETNDTGTDDAQQLSGDRRLWSVRRRSRRRAPRRRRSVANEARKCMASNWPSNWVDKCFNTNYGCCSTNIGFLIGVSKDSAACNVEWDSAENDGKKYQNMEKYKFGEGVSKACNGHDKCLYGEKCTTMKEAGKGCECWGDCDKQLATDLGSASCPEIPWFRCWLCEEEMAKNMCHGVRKVIKGVMSGDWTGKPPNAC